MNVKSVVFFNHWHNGDMFLAKAYMVRLINKFKEHGVTEFYFAHNKSPKLLCDIGTKHVSVHEIPVNETHRVIFDEKQNLYINTWVGAHFGFFGKTQEHSSLTSINAVWVSIYHMVQDMTGVSVLNHREPMNPINGIPTTNWSFFDNTKADAFVSGKPNIALFCNGPCASAQNRNSGIEYMEMIVQINAARNPHYAFVCTQRFDLRMNPNKNIFFTDDIFAGVQDGDINEIAYLSKFCKLIVGKNSGPYMYCHTKDNVFREDCTFFSIGDRQSDCFLYGSYDTKCAHHTFVGKNERNVAVLIDSFMNENQYIALPQYSLINDEKIIKLTEPLDARNF